jgi:hypothetical protein
LACLQLWQERATSRHLARQFDRKKSFLLAENAGILIRQHLASYWFMKTSIFWSGGSHVHISRRSAKAIADNRARGDQGIVLAEREPVRAIADNCARGDRETVFKT